MPSLKQEFRDFVSGFMSSGLSDFLPGLMMAPSESGVAVTEMTAMQVAAVGACIRVLSSSVGMLPCCVYETVDGGANLAPDHNLFPVLHDSPNDEYSAVDFWSLMEVHRVLMGNAYAEIIRDNGGRPRELWIRSPFRTFPYRNLANGKLVYKTTDTMDSSERMILPENLIHVKNLGIDPWVGLSPIRYHMREVIGGAIAGQNYSNRFFANDARPGGYLSNPEVMQPERKLELAKNWNAAHSRAGSHTMAILDGGLQWNSVQVSAEESAFIAQKQMSREDIAAMFGVPVHFLGSSQSERSANLEQKFLEFLVTCLKPNLRRYESELNAKLFSNVGRAAGKFFIKFDTTDFERADFATTLKALQVGRYSGLYTIDEGRKMLGLNPVDPKTLEASNPGGSLWQPVNMVPITDEEIEAPTAPPLDTPISEPGGTPIVPPPAEPGANPDAVTSARAFFSVFKPTFRDAMGRISARTKVNKADFHKVFTPILASVASTYQTGEISPEAANAIRQHIDQMFDRSSNWNQQDLDTTSDTELMSALTALIPVAENTEDTNEANSSK
jgi:HK97 family phage portal protein